MRRRVCKSLLSIPKSRAPLGRSPSHQQHSQHSQHSPEHSSTTTDPSRAQPASKVSSFSCKLAMSWLRKTEYISDSSPPSTRTAASTPDPCVPFLPIKTSALFFLPPQNEPARCGRCLARTTRSSCPTTVPSPLSAPRTSSECCDTLLNRVCVPFRCTRCYRTRTYGRTRTTCSAPVSGQANAGPRCVLSSHPPSVILYAYFWGQLDDPRLDCVIMRPMESDGDHFLNYLTKDDAAEQFKDSRADPRGVDAPREEEYVRFRYIAIFLSLSLIRSPGNQIPLCARLRSGQSRTRSAQ